MNGPNRKIRENVWSVSISRIKAALLEPKPDLGINISKTERTIGEGARLRLSRGAGSTEGTLPRIQRNPVSLGTTLGLMKLA